MRASFSRHARAGYAALAMSRPRSRDRAPLHAALAVVLAAASGCMALPEQGPIDVAAGRVSDSWTVQWDPPSRTPLAMTNKSLADESPSGGEPISEEAALDALRAVFEEHRDWFRLRPGVDDLRLVRSYAQGWLRLVRVEQTYKGLPVAGGGYEARVLPAGRVGSIQGRLYPEIETSIVPSLSAQLAETRAQSAFASGATPPQHLQVTFEWQHAFGSGSALVILPRGGEFALAWGVVIRTPPTGSTRVYVDATSGTVLGYQPVGTDWR
jgi:hypothetical protein